MYYTAEGFGHLPIADGVLVGLPSGGGVTQPLLTNVQLPNQLGRLPWFAAQALSPAGDRIAFIDIAPPLTASLFCDPSISVLSCEPPGGDGELPPLREVVLRVRRFDATGFLDDDPHLRFEIDGLKQLPSPSIFITSLHIVRDHPFQQAFHDERTFVTRPSWAPDGERIVISDGLRLLIWQVGSPNAAPIPNTQDAVSPAWSPDGDWIAFSRFERTDSSTALCQWVGGLSQCLQERTEYLPGRRVLTLIHPDGSGLTELGEGEEPAWSPDGRALYYRHGDAIWLAALDGGDPVRVPGTQGGREPAVSPDGRHLAFAKRGASGYDIWVVDIE